MRKRIIYFGLLALCVLGLNACELFGLSYAYDYEQQHGSAYGTLDCDAYDWLQGRKDNDMTLQCQAIERANMEEAYRADGYTFFVMKNNVWDEWLTSYRYSSIQEVPVATLRAYLERSIVPGKFLSQDISVPVFVQTLDSTVTMRIYKTIVAPTSSQNLNALRAGWTNDNGLINQVSMVTSNLEPTNGALHVQSARFTFMTK